MLSHASDSVGKRNSDSRFFSARMLFNGFRFGRLFAEAKIISVQKLVRLSLAVFEFVYAGQTDRSKDRANRLHLRMLVPNRLSQHFYEMFAQGIVRGAPDLIEQADYALSGRGAIDPW